MSKYHIITINSLSSIKFVEYSLEKKSFFSQGIAVYILMSGLTFGSTYFPFGESRQSHLSVANSVIYLN